jgi:hypothetical protein
MLHFAARRCCISLARWLIEPRAQARSCAVLEAQAEMARLDVISANLFIALVTMAPHSCGVFSLKLGLHFLDSNYRGFLTLEKAGDEKAKALQVRLGPRVVSCERSGGARRRVCWTLLPN